MTKKETVLQGKGYIYTQRFETRDTAKEYASQLRTKGKKATVLEESRRGIYYYSVWCK